MFYLACRAVPLTAFVSGLSRSMRFPVVQQNYHSLVAQCRGYARETTRVVPRRRTFRETLSTPATGTPFAIGQIGLAVASGLGIGALCFYGLGLSNEAGSLERAALWPKYVMNRVQTTYAYLGGSLLLTAASAYGIARSPTLMNLVMRNGWVSLLVTFAAMIGTGAMCRSIAYEPGTFGAKQLAWALHCGVMGAVIAPLTLLGGPILMRAAWYTAGVVGGLSAIAMCAPSEKFMNMGGILGIGLGVVFVSSIGTWFLPPTTMLGAGLYSLALYGGLVLFSGFLLYDTQRVMKLAESYPQFAVRPYDPVNACLGIYLDTLNIFIRIAMILGGGGNRRK